jgi:uroporphyrinogen-III synthase
VKVWVTRSLPGGERQAQALRAAGHECVVAPVIDIEPVRDPAPEGPFDIVIFVSEHAVRLGLPQLDRPHLNLSAATLLAVGPRTAEVLKRAVSKRPGWVTGPVQTGIRADSEGLLALPVLAAVAGRHVLIVSGMGGRELLQEQLVARGARVSRFAVYRRVARLLPGASQMQAGRDGTATEFPPVTVDAISAGSGDGLAAVALLWFGAGGRADVACLVPSARLVDSAVALGFRSVHDCGGADDASVLRGLERIRGARDTDRSSERHTR